MSVSKWIRAALIGSVLSSGAVAFGELDPELAQASKSAKNDAGLFATGYLTFGSSQAAGKSRPGTAILAGAEIGYALPRDSWGRLQGSLLGAAGLLKFKGKGTDHESQSVSIGAMPIVRGGYAYSLGNNAMFLWQLGAGTFLGSYDTKIGGQNYESTTTFLGVVGQIGGQLLLSPSSWYEFVLGLDWTHYSFDVDRVKNTGVTPTEMDVNRSFNVNSPTLSLGFRIKL